MFAEILHPALAGVKQALKSEAAEVFVFPASGVGGWETALTNTMSQGDKFLAARNGMCSHRWIDRCGRLGLIVDMIEARWGEGLPADRCAPALAADKGH